MQVTDEALGASVLLTNTPTAKHVAESAPGRMLLPDDINGIATYVSVGCHQCHGFLHRLGDQESVERISMERRQLTEPIDVHQFDRQELQVVLPLVELDEFLQRCLQRKLAELMLDLYFPAEAWLKNKALSRFPQSSSTRSEHFSGWRLSQRKT